MQPKTLLKWATDLRRRIYASLPWGYRVAVFFRRLASGIMDAFGRIMYAEFIKRGVNSMPDIGGKPAHEWQERLTKAGTRAGDMLPRGTGREFAEKAWKILLKLSRDPETTEEVMTLVIEKFVKNPNLIREGSDLRVAEGYIIQSLKSHLYDYLRATKRRTRLVSPGLTTENDEGDTVNLDVRDPESWREIGEMLPQAELKEILHALERLHPSAAAFLDLTFQGYTPAEMAREGLLPHLEGKPVSPSNLYQWIERWKPRIQEVLQQHIDMRQRAD